MIFILSAISNDSKSCAKGFLFCSTLPHQFLLTNSSYFCFYPDFTYEHYLEFYISEMATPGGVTPGRMGADESTRAPTMQYICGECHQEQEIRPKVFFRLFWYIILLMFRIRSDAENVGTEFCTRKEPED